MKQIAQNALLDVSRRELVCIKAFKSAKSDDLGSKEKHQAYWDMERAKAKYLRLKIQRRFNVSMMEY